MSNDDFGLEDLTPNILDEWERWASDRPDRETKQDANERKIIALVRAVRRLRADAAPKKTCACGLEPDTEEPFSYGHGRGMCLVEEKWFSAEAFRVAPREIIAEGVKLKVALEAEQRAHGDTRTRLERTDRERAAEWRRAERFEAAATALARIVSGDDSSPDGAGLGRWGGPMALTDTPWRTS